NTDTGVLYGVFHLLRRIQTLQSIDKLFIEDKPRLNIRILNHWDNLDGTVERGYAGFSIWNWHKLPDYIDPRYIDYARANASVGINGAVVTNVNANAQILTPEYLVKVAALADVFRPYGIKIYLSARFSAPMEIGNLKTADPLNPEVRKWWKDKIDELYQRVPDFGGFVVKANSEGQPGPQNYGRSHADGANMLAEALEPHHGIVMWRAFVYDDKVPDDRARQAFNEFKPLDGQFLPNVLVQVKNGAIDFQPREPFHPLFGAMPKTPLMMEFQITQEYLGFSTHLVYLGTLFKETLNADTYVKGPGSTVSKVIDGMLDGHALSGMAGVANIGTDRNWCGNIFAQSNWYAFGRLAWNTSLDAGDIAEEWIRMTFSNKADVIKPVKSMMMASREICVDYMTPLGLHHIMGWNHHYGPGPWVKNKPRADWTSVYYHKADSLGIGFNRTSTGSNALEQYAQPVQEQWSNPHACPENLLLWFHHEPWDFKMKSGETLWNTMCKKYNAGVDSVRWMQSTWSGLQGKIDTEEFDAITMMLKIQEKEAAWWRDACLLYFQSFSRRPIPANYPQPKESLEYYIKQEFPYAPGIKPRW
ncbi:MAG TPA: alpha-glucuronidase, partial [Cyclobacteriaceae bacterium]|nr:alpha-glucuronidase [Cyclobacteriaceae bacterium]